MPLDEELEKIKKLSPEERIKKLKELEEERKKEIAAAEELMRESEREISDDAELKRKVPIHQVRATDFSTMSGESESAKEIWKTAHFRSTLEETTSTGSELERAAQSAPSSQQEEAKGVMYQIERKAEQQGELYGKQETAATMDRPGTFVDEAEAARGKYTSGGRRERRAEHSY